MELSAAFAPCFSKAQVILTCSWITLKSDCAKHNLAAGHQRL